MPDDSSLSKMRKHVPGRTDRVAIMCRGERTGWPSSDMGAGPEVMADGSLE
ncbi:MAG: hypothetical protein Q4A32_05015 [Lachnospiraceae bacterium]|nr:hypothetical protein [Lachnospiraceae bacterium]